jgi:hypothetical protein
LEQLVPRRLHRWFADSVPMTRREFYALFGLLFLFITILMFGLAYQVNQNRHRASEAHANAAAARSNARDLHAAQQIILETQTKIQQSRIASCQQTYRSFREILGPFATPRAKQTAQQRAQVDRFNRIIAAKIKGCVKQTSKNATPRNPATPNTPNK